MVISNINSYLMDLGLKLPLVLGRFFRGEALLEVYVAKSTVVIREDFCCLVALLARSALQLGN